MQIKLYALCSQQRFCQRFHTLQNHIHVVVAWIDGPHRIVQFRNHLSRCSTDFFQRCSQFTFLCLLLINFSHLTVHRNTAERRSHIVVQVLRNLVANGLPLHQLINAVTINGINNQRKHYGANNKKPGLLPVWRNDCHAHRSDLLAPCSRCSGGPHLKRVIITRQIGVAHILAFAGVHPITVETLQHVRIVYRVAVGIIGSGKFKSKIIVLVAQRDFVLR